MRHHKLASGSESCSTRTLSGEAVVPRNKSALEETDLNLSPIHAEPHAEKQHVKV